MAYNATLSPLPPHSLYADIDIGGLNWFEKQWMAWYIWIGNPVIATGLMSFLMHEVSHFFAFHLGLSHRVQTQIVYFGRCIPWIIIDAIPYFRKWKLQPKKIPSPQQQWECTKVVLFSHFMVELPVVSDFVP
jgi:methylsterol monooxygenase